MRGRLKETAKDVLSLVAVILFLAFLWCIGP